ncbi:MAG: GNAT family N-acetyltransferase [Alphaproteobacteria bacterium]|nr:GNAT family N-acetyltransferase [Alphaproteobacteria bacterium]
MTAGKPAKTPMPAATAPAAAAAEGGRPVYFQSGQLEVRLAESPHELDAAQELRFRVFYDEMSAKPTAAMAASRRDVDSFDPHCDHLLLLDVQDPARPKVVATYRLLRRERATAAGGFYTASEYAIEPLLALPGEILELGRSCVDAAFRTRAVMTLIWRGIAHYVLHHKIDLMFGCASLPGIDPRALQVELSYLHHFHLAPPELRVRALPERYVPMAILPREAIDQRRALASLPPLVKGYLRLGGFIGDGAVVDEQFNTTDVCVVVKTDLVTDKYFKHFTRESEAE